MYIPHTVVTYGTSKEWEFLSNEYDREKDFKMKILLQEAMSKTKDLGLLERFLNNQMNETKVNRQDCLIGITSAAKTLYGYNFTWNFVKNNWNKLYEKYIWNRFFKALLTAFFFPSILGIKIVTILV
jgi:hypothetical protein